jgi:hypothetical protein
VQSREQTRTLVGLLVEAEEDASLRASLAATAERVRHLMAGVTGVAPESPQAWLSQAMAWGLALQHLLFVERSPEDVQALLAHAFAQRAAPPLQAPSPRTEESPFQQRSTAGPGASGRARHAVLASGERSP